MGETLSKIPGWLSDLSSTKDQRFLLLKDKIIELKNDSDSIDNDWSPQLNLGLSVLIPEKYIY